jgi:hypothetical protein
MGIQLMEEKNSDVFVDANVTNAPPPPPTPHMIGHVTPFLDHGADTHSEFREFRGARPSYGATGSYHPPTPCKKSILVG